MWKFEKVEKDLDQIVKDVGCVLYAETRTLSQNGLFIEEKCFERCIKRV